MKTDYAMARAHGSLSRLLGREGLRDLLAAPGLAARIERLRASDWRLAVPAKTATGTSDAALVIATERGILARLSNDLALAERWLGAGRPSRLLAAAFAGDESWTVVTTLRAIGRGLPVPRLSPTPRFPAGALAELAASPGIAETTALLETWRSPMGTAIAAALPEWRSSGNTRALERAAERAAFARAFEDVRGSGADAAIVRRHLARHVDLVNCRRLLEGAGPSEPLVAGGAVLDEATFSRLSALERDGRRKALADRRGPFAPEGFPLADMEDPFRTEMRLRAYAVERMREEARREPLSIAVLLRWLLERRHEAATLRLVLRASVWGIPPETLLPLLEAA